MENEIKIVMHGGGAVFFLNAKLINEVCVCVSTVSRTLFPSLDRYDDVVVQSSALCAVRCAGNSLQAGRPPGKCTSTST